MVTKQDELTREEVNFVLKKTDNLACPSWNTNGLDPYTPKTWNTRGRCAYINEHKDKITEDIKGRIVIELGPGCNPFFIGEPCEYIGVDPFLSNINSLEKILSEKQLNVHFGKLRKENKLKAILNDAYSFLKEQPDSSAIIYSLGLFDVYNNIGGKTYGKEFEIVKKYAQALVNQIARVTPENRITFHAGVNFADYFLKAGFVPLNFDFPSGEPSSSGLFYIKHKIAPGTFFTNPLDSKEAIIVTEGDKPKIKCIRREEIKW